MTLTSVRDAETGCAGARSAERPGLRIEGRELRTASLRTMEDPVGIRLDQQQLVIPLPVDPGEVEGGEDWISPPLMGCGSTRAASKMRWPRTETEVAVWS